MFDSNVTVFLHSFNPQLVGPTDLESWIRKASCVCPVKVTEESDLPKFMNLKSDKAVVWYQFDTHSHKGTSNYFMTLPGCEWPDKLPDGIILTLLYLLLESPATALWEWFWLSLRCLKETAQASWQAAEKLFFRSGKATKGLLGSLVSSITRGYRAHFGTGFNKSKLSTNIDTGISSFQDDSWGLPPNSLC